LQRNQGIARLGKIGDSALPPVLPKEADDSKSPSLQGGQEGTPFTSQIQHFAWLRLVSIRLVSCLVELGERRRANPDSFSSRSGVLDCAYSSGRSSVLHLTSKDGTRIAYKKEGKGPPLLIMGGSLADHHFYAPLAQELANDFTVYNFDRRGRGASSDTLPYEVEREVEDVAALIDEAGDQVCAYGHSAGSALAIRAAAAGLGIKRLALADPPFTPPSAHDQEARAQHSSQKRHIEELNAAGDYKGSVKFFLSDYGLPDESLEAMLQSPAGESMVALARVLPYDFAMLGDGIVPGDLAARITVPTAVLAAEGTPETAQALAAVMPRAEFRPMPASAHELSPAEIAKLVLPFFKE
jgi:pimeloyl-ACP methyl ester carboxylesterase